MDLDSHDSVHAQEWRGAKRFTSRLALITQRRVPAIRAAIAEEACRFTFSAAKITLSSAPAIHRKPIHLGAGGSTGRQDLSPRISVTTPMTAELPTGTSQQTLASPQVIRKEMPREVTRRTRRWATTPYFET
jgi:hypothetical protein